MTLDIGPPALSSLMTMMNKTKMVTDFRKIRNQVHEYNWLGGWSCKTLIVLVEFWQTRLQYEHWHCGQERMSRIFAEEACILQCIPRWWGSINLGWLVQSTAPPPKGSAVGYFLYNPPLNLFIFSLFDAMIPRMYSKYTRGDIMCAFGQMCVWKM